MAHVPVGRVNHTGGLMKKHLNINQLYWEKYTIEEETNHYYVVFDVDHYFYIPKIDDETHINICFAAAWTDGFRMKKNKKINGFNVRMDCTGFVKRKLNGWPCVQLVVKKENLAV
jgi:hypothetical protein